MRYQFTPVYKRFDGKNVYRTTYYPIIPDSVDDTYIIASESDYLDSLAKKYYGDESYWWVIAQANNLGKGKLSIPQGKQLRIPGNVSQILNNLKNLN
jgi:nucleoid-associated protein YgaU